MHLNHNIFFKYLSNFDPILYIPGPGSLEESFVSILSPIPNPTPLNLHYKLIYLPICLNIM